MADYSSMKWNLRKIPTEDLFLEYPELETAYNEVKLIVGDAFLKVEAEADKSEDWNNPYKEHKYHPGLSPQQAVSLVIYSYHLGSPLVRESSMHKRRGEALKLLGFTLHTQQDLQENKFLVQYIVGANTFINYLALHFCKLEQNFKWLELCRKQDMLDDVFLTLKEEQMGTEKKSANEILKIKLEIEAKTEPLQMRINQLANEIFSSDIHLLNYSAANVILEKRKPLITPERIVEREREKIKGR